MRDEVKERLDASLAGGPVPRAAPDDPRGAAPPDAAFARAFLARAERVVVPAMVEVGRILERHGRFFSIERIAERVTCRGVLVPTSVQMNVFRRHRTVNFRNGAPHFNVVCDRTGRRVLFRRTLAPPAAGPEDVGSCTLDALTRDLVQDRLTAMLDALARG